MQRHQEKNNPKYNRELNEAINSRNPEHYFNELADKRASGITSPIKFEDHLFDTEFNKRGNLTGGHSTARGKINITDRGESDSLGVYRARIPYINPKTGKESFKI